MSELLHSGAKFTRKGRKIFFSGRSFTRQISAALKAIEGSTRAISEDSADIIVKISRSQRASWTVNERGILEISAPFFPSKNHVLSELWAQDLARACDAACDLSCERVTWSMVRTAEDARECAQAITCAGEHVTDVETFAPMHTDKFKIVCMASSSPAIDHVWLWPEEALKAGTDTREIARQLIKTVQLVAHNLKFEISAFSQFFDLRLGPECCAADTLALAKLELPHESGALAAWTGIAGMAGHKDEAGALVKEAANTLAKVRRKSRKEIATAWEYQQRTTKTGKLQRRKVITERRKPTPEESQAVAVEALRDAIGPQIERLDDWLEAVKSDAPLLSYAYGLADRGVIMKYCALDVLSTSRLRRVFRKTEKEFSAVLAHHRLTPWALSDVERNGMLVDRAKLEANAQLIDKMEKEKLEEIHEVAPGINPGSSNQVADLLFEKLKKEPLEFSKKTKKPSCDKKTLQAYSDEKVIADILEFRKISKINGTYAIGLVDKIGEDGRIRPSINATGTETGRFSCSGPNLQQIPSRSDLSPLIKGCFIPSENCQIVQIDYSTLEVRIVAMLSGDQKMIDIFKRGGDFHREAAIKISRVLWGSEFADCGGLEGDALGLEQKDRRSVVKGVVFGTIYGQSTKGLAELHGIEEKQAEAAHRALVGEFADFGQWVKRTKRDAARAGKVSTTWAGKRGRVRHLPKLGEQATKSDGERQAVNTPVQGSGAEYCTASLVEICKYIRDSAIDARVIMTVHDSIIAEVHDLDVDEYCENAKRIMESWDAGGVPIKVDIETGKNWAELKNYEKKKE